MSTPTTRFPAAQLTRSGHATVILIKCHPDVRRAKDLGQVAVGETCLIRQGAARTSSGGVQCLSFGSGSGEDGRHAVHMLAQFIADLLPHGIQEELHAFTPCKLCRRHEIAITRHQNARSRKKAPSFLRALDN